MTSPTSYSVRLAITGDIPAMVPLINAAFAVERDIVDGDRTDPKDLAEHFDEGQFLLAENSEGELLGSVYLELREGRAYMGMLAVHPSARGTGMARRLMSEVEAHARAAGCDYLDIYVLSARPELPPLYHKFGYTYSGARMPHPDWAHRLKVPCYLLKMTKPL